MNNLTRFYFRQSQWPENLFHYVVLPCTSWEINNNNDCIPCNNFLWLLSIISTSQSELAFTAIEPLLLSIYNFHLYIIGCMKIECLLLIARPWIRVSSSINDILLIFQSIIHSEIWKSMLYRAAIRVMPNYAIIFAQHGKPFVRCGQSLISCPIDINVTRQDLYRDASRR